MIDFFIDVLILNNILIFDIFGYFYRICRLFFIIGKNFSGIVGYLVINLGINNLFVIVKIDIVNRLVDCFMMLV